MSQEPIDSGLHPLTSAVSAAVERSTRAEQAGATGSCGDPLISYDNLLVTMDARVWARAFKATAERLRGEGKDTLDEGWLIGWFANAIMRGYDTGLEHAHARRWLGSDEQQTPLTLDQIKDQAITAALGRTNHNLARSARELAVDRRTLYRRLTKSRKSTP